MNMAEQNIDIQIQSVVTAIAEACIRESMTIVTAESCTGGGVAYELTSLPGSSQWYDRGFVTYSNLAKIEMLGVLEESLNKYGAVSEEIAIEMVEGALKHSSANVSIAITGIAGPAGGSEKKPVGTCYLAWSSTSFSTECKHFIFPGDRISVRRQAILFSLSELLQLLNNCFF